MKWQDKWEKHLANGMGEVLDVFQSQQGEPVCCAARTDTGTIVAVYGGSLLVPKKPKYRPWTMEEFLRQGVYWFKANPKNNAATARVFFAVEAEFRGVSLGGQPHFVTFESLLDGWFTHNGARCGIPE